MNDRELLRQALSALRLARQALQQRTPWSERREIAKLCSDVIGRVEPRFSSAPKLSLVTEQKVVEDWMPGWIREVCISEPSEDGRFSHCGVGVCDIQPASIMSLVCGKLTGVE